MKPKKSLSAQYEFSKIRNGFDFVIGSDEVGRGCLAGPVVAAAVVFDKEFNMKDLSEVRDSKLLRADQREKLDTIIRQCCVAWGIGVVSGKKIDQINIHHASLLAMKLAVQSAVKTLSVQPVACESEPMDDPKYQKNFSGNKPPLFKTLDVSRHGLSKKIVGQKKVSGESFQNKSVLKKYLCASTENLQSQIWSIRKKRSLMGMQKYLPLLRHL